MEKHVLSAALAAALLCTGGTALAQSAAMQTTKTTTTTTRTDTAPMTMGSPEAALSESEIKTDVANAGYKMVKGLKFRDGVWQAQARGGNQKWSDIRVGPTTGKVYAADAPSHLNRDEVTAKLTAQGFQNIQNVKFDKGLWRAEARTPHGATVKLLVDPDDGSVVATSHG